MPRTRGKKKKHRAKTGGGTKLSPPLNPLRRGMPAQDSITGVKEMKRDGTIFRIIKTTELDEYEPAARKHRKKS